MALTPRRHRGGTYPYGIRRFQRPERGEVTEAGVSVVGAGSAARVRRVRAEAQAAGQAPEQVREQVPEQVPDKAVALKADALRDLLGRLLATGSC